LESAAFEAGATIPKRHTCDGDNTSPPLRWTGAPKGTKSLLLVCVDPDAPGGLFHHWAAYNIPPELTHVDESFGDAARNPACPQAINDFRKTGYGGPCPPKGDRPHGYRFRLSALSEPISTSGHAVACRQIIRLAKAHEIATAELIGHYGRR
jgi:Raf kinase inhibitor-like YbhB/YbcL family protein